MIERLPAPARVPNLEEDERIALRWRDIVEGSIEGMMRTCASSPVESMIEHDEQSTVRP